MKTISVMAAAVLISTTAFGQMWSNRDRGNNNDRSNRGNNSNNNFSRTSSDFSGGGSSSALPTDFSILQSKSIFSRDRRPGFTSGTRFPQPGDPGYRDPGDGRRRNRVPALRGILHQPDGYVGLLEVPRSGDIVIIRKGDTLPDDAGTVTDISLDSINVSATANQPQRKILVGQNLQGGVAEVEASSSSTDSGSSSQPGSGDSSASSTPPPDLNPPSTGNPSLDEIRARLMARRKQQNGGK